MGRKYDHHLAVEHRTYNAFMPEREGKIDGRVTFDGGSIGVELSRNEGGFIFNEIPKQTNPKERDALIKAMQQSATDGNFTFRVEHKWVSAPHLSTAVLHSAYLALFREYGYEYAACADADWIRAALQADDPPEKPQFISINVPPDAGFTSDRIFGCGAARMGGLKVLVAALPSANPKFAARLVLLPGIGERGRSDYQQLMAMPSGKVTIDYHFHFCVPEKRLRAKGEMWFLNHFWDSLA
jgi:hypothetical protein